MPTTAIAHLEDMLLAALDRIEHLEQQRRDVETELTALRMAFEISLHPPSAALRRADLIMNLDNLQANGEVDPDLRRAFGSMVHRLNMQRKDII